MASKSAQRRLSKDFRDLQRSPPPFIWAAPEDNNILHWNFILRGPPDCPYAGGEYYGHIAFPPEFPSKPPSIKMFTPSGRFQPNEIISWSTSYSFSDLWSPVCTPAYICIDLLSFMISDEAAPGSVTSTDAEKRDFASRSHEWNRKQKRFRDAFPDYCGEEMRDLPNMGEQDRGVATEEATETTAIPTQPPDVHVSAPTIPTARRMPFPEPTHEMSIVEIVDHIGQHGCNDVTRQLDESKCSEYPVSEDGFGDVYQGALRDGRLVNLKCLRLHRDSTEVAKKQLKYAARELCVWSNCDHPNLLSLVGVARFRNRVVMVSPWVENGSLSLFLARQPQVNRLALCVQIADGVAYLHDKGIAHGDIKGDNVLFSQDSTPKLSDFVSAALREYSLQFTNTTNRAGTSLNWVAPEMLNEETKVTLKADIYSLGMTILEVITGSIPYAGMREAAVVMKIVKGIHPVRPEEYMPPQPEQAGRLWSLLTRCWAYNPQDRPTATHVRDEMARITSGVVSGVPAR